MPVNLNNNQPINHTDPEFGPMLNDLQGNILSGHGRDNSVLLFVRFTGTNLGVRTWIRTFATNFVTTARQQLEEAQNFRDSGVSGAVFGNFMLTRTGYDFLGDLQLPADPGFQGGLKAARSRLNDPDPNHWNEGYQSTIHALLLLADDDEARLSATVTQTQASLNGIAQVLALEKGKALRNQQGEHIEHFGYVDGRSQPLFLQQAFDMEASIEGVTNWDPFASLGLVLVPDPNTQTEDSFGSYFVFRKLEQNVRQFKQMEDSLAQSLGLQGSEAARAGALAVGRFKDGTPVTLHQQEGMSHPVPNNFTYEADSQGLKCPFQAHIRKANPRGDTVRQFGEAAESERSHRIARRGIPYGTREVEPKDNPSIDQLPTGGVGLLFMCFQSSIMDQFEFIQATWANNTDFLQSNTGIDPVIGQANVPQPHQWPIQWGEPLLNPFGNFHDFVTLKGGEYFFAPSLNFLRNL